MALADTIASYSDGTESSEVGTTRYVGQSFTTGNNPFGYSLASISLLGSSGSGYEGNGTLYLYSSAFTGDVSNLASGGDLVTTVTYNSSDQAWDFSGVTLSADTTYHFYIAGDSSYYIKGLK